MGPREHRFPSVFEGGLPCERLSFQRLLRSVRQAIASRCRQGFGIEPLSAGAVERRVREYCVVRLSVRVHRPTGKRPSPLRAQGGKGRWWLGNARVPRLLDGDGAFGEVPQHAARERGSVSGPCAAPPHPRQRATRCIRTRNLLRTTPWTQRRSTLSARSARVDDTRRTRLLYLSNPQRAIAWGIAWGLGRGRG